MSKDAFAKDSAGKQIVKLPSGFVLVNPWCAWRLDKNGWIPTKIVSIFQAILLKNRATWRWREPTCLFFYINSDLDLWPWPWLLVTLILFTFLRYEFFSSDLFSSILSQTDTRRRITAHREWAQAGSESSLREVRLSRRAGVIHRLSSCALPSVPRCKWPRWNLMCTDWLPQDWPAV